MKTFLKVGFFLVLNVIASLFTVSAQSSVKIGEINITSQPIITLSSSSIIAAVENAFADGSTFSSVSIDHPSGETPYLVLRGTRNGGCLTVAITLNISNNDYLMMASALTHTCYGNPCNLCVIMRSGGVMTGYGCIDSGGRCDHAVEDSYTAEVVDELNAF